MPRYNHKPVSPFTFKSKKENKLNHKFLNKYSLDIIVLKALSKVAVSKIRAHYHLGIPHLINITS